MLEISTSPELLIDWNRLEPVIDEILHALNERDRELILLRYFQNKSFVEISLRLGLSANAARFRVMRALEKMRARLVRRGINSTSTALAVALAGQAEAAAPAGLTTLAATTALAFASGAETSAFSLMRFLGSIKGVFSASGALWLGGLLCVPAVGSAIHEVRINRHAQAELAAAKNKFETEMPQPQALARKLQSSEQARSKLFDAPPRSRVWDPRAEAQKFLNTFPQARALFLQMGVTDAFYSFGGFLRTSNLTPGQIQQFEALIASTWVNNLEATPEIIGAGSGDPSFEQLRQVLGAAGAREFQAYEETMQYPYKFTTAAAAVASAAGAPLTEQQIDQLAQIIASNSGPHKTNMLGLDSRNWEAARDAVVWDAVITQARAVLSSEQFSRVQERLLILQYNAALDQAGQNRARLQGKP